MMFAVVILTLFPSSIFCTELEKFSVTHATERNAICNDGTEAIYYLRKNTESQAWLIFLQGGGGCYNDVSCDERKRDFPWYTTASLSNDTLDVQGILSDDCEVNPAFCESNFLFLHYCSSDWWSGNKSNNNGFNFLGKNLIKAVIEDSFFYHHMIDAKKIVLSGSSAGGVGAMSNSDFVKNLLMEKIPNIDYSIVADSGWFLDGKGLFEFPCEDSNKCNFEKRLTMGQRMWNLWPHEKCGEKYVGHEWKCLIGYHLYPHIEARKMMLFNQFDQYQAWQDGIYKNSLYDMTGPEKEFVYFRGQFTFNSIFAAGVLDNGIWAQGCFSHGIVGHKSHYHKSPTNDGVTAAAALLEFVTGKTPKHVDICSSLDCNQNCS